MREVRQQMTALLPLVSIPFRVLNNDGGIIMSAATVLYQAPIRPDDRFSKKTSINLIEPDWDTSRLVANAAGADIDRCWTCGTCDNGCPVSLATGRLRPQRNVRMAVYGMLDRLLTLPDIWYCLSCRRCLQGCPNRVKPFELHRYLRNEALQRGIYAHDFLTRYQRLFAEFQRVRWRAAAHCLKGKLTALPDDTWYQWLKQPLHHARYRPVDMAHTNIHNAARPAELLSGQACFTCSECSSCCPIVCGGDVFDPQRIIRMANLGIVDELLRSPAIWLCLGCQRCVEACSQTVSGHAIIRRLQMQAIEEGFVDPFLPVRLLDADRIIYPKFLDEIDTLIGLYRIK
jgi:heterodisulfide reductase subunit C